jgi:uncharacterized membrane protein YqhA
VKAVLERSRFVAFIGVAGLLATSVIAAGWSVAKTIKFAIDLLDGAWSKDLAVVKLLVVVEGYLLAVLPLIVAVGLHELFIDDLDVPEWMEAKSLSDLKGRIIDALVVFVAIKGVERLIAAARPMDALIGVGAVAVLLVALAAFVLPAKLRAKAAVRSES